MNRFFALLVMSILACSTAGCFQDRAPSPSTRPPEAARTEPNSIPDGQPGKRGSGPYGGAGGAGGASIAGGRGGAGGAGGASQ